MKFLVDVCVGRSIANWLIQEDYDVIEVSTHNPKMSDLDILAWAYQEGRILITLDKDFGKLTFRIGVPHSGVIRLPNVQRDIRWELLQTVLKRHTKELEERAIVTVKPGKIRITKQ